MFGVTAASDPDAARWTPTPTVRPNASAWTVPSQASQPGATTPEAPDEPAEQLPRPRHRAPLPDLSRAGTWNAFDTSRRERRDAQDSAPASTGETATPVDQPTGSPVPASAPTSTDDPTSTGTGTGDPTSTDDPASTDATAATPADATVAEQPSRRGRLGGLFRRNRSRGDEASSPTSDETEPLATQDEEFVDWVAGLSKPVWDNEPKQENGRRSLRTSGRHHRD
ncbi:hypothetical protein [Micromonospora tarensis]|uniref:Uncharacterized protein n=1 Tax=Micromonospora tarensis TaxID=2806100 RepID=A0ABS1YL38_9ACTN|nr:hypothetical protein [Micromonospora tarensis]MBM0278052.1 hypothetical protein [Micromonospora tarensis]